ncbi:uncharacterized protein LOC112043988 [Bicyclus anynana]|uniref:Uncharacterized protein LOC112043988 n=1 Tax=Bicyclus anynana TaxID=110368 RepID=A0A6J1MLW8_BICAN|nr:uncharacterized protein LOC112043988 [Bicyclus anynana]
MASVPRAVTMYKKQTITILRLLHRSQPMITKISHLIFEENGMEKPTQNLFYNISYYLLFLIDPQVHASLTWPLYDTKVEKAFRSQLSAFISDYAAKGVLTDVRSSYLVHPNCFKISVLIHQLSVLALKRMLLEKIKNSEKQVLFNEITDKYNKRSDNESFLEHMSNLDYENKVFVKLSEFLCKKQRNEKIAAMLCMKITKCEAKLKSLNAQGYIDKLVNGFLSKHNLDDMLKSEILKIKNVKEPAPIFDERLQEVDKQLDVIEHGWDSKVLLLLDKCRSMRQLSEEIIKRHTGQVQKSCYMLEYDPINDVICTDDLQTQVNTDQKYVLKNLIINGRLNLPNLIRAYLISVCFILKNNTFGDEIYEFNNHIGARVQEYDEVLSAMKALVEKVRDAEKKLQPTPSYDIQSVSLEEDLVIPPLPDLFGIKMNQNQYHINFDTFTPLHLSKHRFNLHKRDVVFTKPQPRSMLTYHAPKDDFLKTLMASRASTYDQANMSHMSNFSMISNIKANETIAECSSGFTKQQITRLLSTNKKSSHKKLKKQDSHNEVSFKRCGLFKESLLSNDSHGLVRSYSSPNLLENRESRIPISKIRQRKLSIMQEDSPLDVSGVTSLDNFNTPPGSNKFGNSRNTLSYAKISDEVKNRLDVIQNEFESAISPILEQETHFSNAAMQESRLPKPITKGVPIITLTTTQKQESYFSKTLKDRELQESHSLNTITKDLSRISISPVNLQESHSKTVTPKTNSALIKKTSSLEKIINRFKQIRSNTLHKDEDIQTIDEEKENFNTNNAFPANRNLLPDLLSPNVNCLRSNSDVSYVDAVDFDMDDVVHRIPRVSLGTMLGVDHTFLDQFDLID